MIMLAGISGQQSECIAGGRAQEELARHAVEGGADVGDVGIGDTPGRAAVGQGRHPAHGDQAGHRELRFGVAAVEALVDAAEPGQQPRGVNTVEEKRDG
jgi:hypothetical protein